MLFVLLCCLVALCQGVLGEGEHHIISASGLKQFSKDVNNGTTYYETTVFLDADIDFSGGLSEQFEPIGYWKSSSDNKPFQGTFDGQGHTISNLAINSSSQLAGLFGYSKGATIRNVVLDSSCSVVSSFSGSIIAYIGGIIGYCSGCTIENTVNMASVAFTGSTSSYLYIGGIAGDLYSSYKDVNVRNCANYGSVTHSGTIDYANIGGIVGGSGGSSSNKVFIQNCLNYGTIKHNGITTDTLCIGGILGYSIGASNIENCVSGGKIVSNKASNYIGSIVGHIYSGKINIKHCYWTSDVGCDNASGDESPTVDSETKQVELNTTTVDSLNSYNNSWNKWLLNTNNKAVTFKDNNGNGFSLSSQLILFPSLAESENHTFSGWFEDEECTKEFAGSVVAETTLYGGWSYVVIFDFGNGGAATTLSKNVVYGQKYGELPSATRTGHTFAGWFTEREEGKERRSQRMTL